MTDMPGFVLETDRLALRRLTPGDLDALAMLYSDAEVRRFFPEGTLTREQTLEEIEWMLNVDYARYGIGLWATILKATGAFIGRCGLLPWTVEDRPEVEVAYMLARPYWHQGLATEAARALLRYGFERLPITRIIALIDPGNNASVNVARRSGMTLYRDMILENMPTLIYACDRPADAPAYGHKIT